MKKNIFSYNPRLDNSITNGPLLSIFGLELTCNGGSRVGEYH